MDVFYIDGSVTWDEEAATSSDSNVASWILTLALLWVLFITRRSVLHIWDQTKKLPPQVESCHNSYSTSQPLAKRFSMWQRGTDPGYISTTSFRARFQIFIKRRGFTIPSTPQTPSPEEPLNTVWIPSPQDLPSIWIPLITWTFSLLLMHSVFQAGSTSGVCSVTGQRNMAEHQYNQSRLTEVSQGQLEFKFRGQVQQGKFKLE